MTRTTRSGSTVSSFRCDSCGQLPEPGKTRLTLANVAVMLPIELAVHAVVVQTDLNYVLKALLLAVTATALVIRVAEPSVMRDLGAGLAVHPGSTGEPLIFSRVGEPSTTAESARAHRLSELAAVVAHSHPCHRAAS